MRSHAGAWERGKAAGWPICTTQSPAKTKTGMFFVKPD
jgi:hypothetical protein